MRLYVGHNIQITCGTAGCPGFPFACQAYAGIVIDSRWDLDPQAFYTAIRSRHTDFCGDAVYGIFETDINRLLNILAASGGRMRPRRALTKEFLKQRPKAFGKIAPAGKEILQITGLETPCPCATPKRRTESPRKGLM